MLEAFQKKVEQAAEGYADLVIKAISDAKSVDQMTPEIMGKANEGIRMLNHVANTLERINRIQYGAVSGMDTDVITLRPGAVFSMNGKGDPESRSFIPLYDKEGNKRNPLEVLKEVQKELEPPITEGYTLELDENELATEHQEEPGTDEKMIGWCVGNAGADGNIEIRPMGRDRITIHGEEEAWFFICRLLDYIEGDK